MKLLLLGLLYFTLTIATVTTNGLVGNGIPINGIVLNGVSFNAIVANGVSFNALASNALVANSLTYNGLEMIGNQFNVTTTWKGFDASALQELPIPILPINSDLDALLYLLHYVVECSLPSGVSWSPKLSNGTSIEYAGMFGFAPHYVDTPLSLSEEEWLTACILVHVNAFGKHIEISVRNVATIGFTNDEEEHYRSYEGAFFGNVFEIPQRMFSCQGTPEPQALAESSDRTWRVCTDVNHDHCPISIGYCADHCSLYTRDFGYSSCTYNGTVFSRVLNVYLSTSSASTMMQSLFVIVLILVFALF